MIFLERQIERNIGRQKTFPIEQKVTYKMIQTYVLLDNFGLKTHTRYIEIKRKNGLSMACVRETDNPKNPIPHPTPAMTEAIKSTLKFYGWYTTHRFF